MPPQPITDQTLRAENAELRAQLQEAQEILRAIRAAEVDALVVEGDAGPQLFTLQGLDAAQNRLRGEMLAQVNDAVIAVDVEERITFLNAAAERQYGVRADEVLGRHLSAIFTPQWPSPEAEAGLRAALGARGQWRGELSHRTPDGRELHVETSVATLRAPDGTGIGYVVIIRDIHERKQAEAALRLTNERFDLAVRCSQVVLFQQDLELRYTWLQNPAPGFDGSDAVGKRDVDLMQRFADAVVTEDLKREVIRSGVNQRQEVVVHIQGAAQHYDLLVEPLRDAAGLVSGVTCAAIDITARKQAEEARQKSDDHLRYALQAATAGAWDWDILSGEVVWSAENYLLYDVDPAQGLPRYADWESRLHPADRDRTNEHVRAVLAGREAKFRTEFRIVSRHGTVRWLLGLGQVECDPDGQPLRMSGINIDITLRKHAEAALRDSERQYSALADASSETAYRMSADWSTMLPLDGRDLVASSDQLLGDWAWLDQNLPRDEHARVRQAISEAIARKGLFALEHRVWHRDGSIGWTSSRAVPLLDEKQDVVAWFGAASDITERKRIELDLIHATAVAEKANRAKSDFLSNMSHELRTPLNAILGFAQLLESGAPAPTPAHRRNLEQIIKAGWYLLDLINEILDLALIESGRLSLTLEPVALAEVMLECRAMFEPQARMRGIGMTFPSFEVPGYVRADRTRLKQVLINLLSNAIKYNKPQGAVAVEWTLSPPDSIRLSVKDTGEGLAPAQLAQLFQPFNRLGKEAGTEEGTGIGLVLTKSLVESMGGAVGADSVVGVGSVFWVELTLATGPLPAACAAQLTAAPQAATQADAQLRTVLYVEDNPANVMLFEGLMAHRQDIRLLTAMDGNRGIEIARAAAPDVIVMDIRMPGMSGIEALKILREDPSTAQIPVIAFSANAGPEDIQTCLALGFARYITKPIKFNELMGALDVTLKV